MKEFLKFTLATIFGIFISTILLIVILVSITAAIIAGASTEQKKTIESNTVLHLKFDYPIGERTSTNPFDNFDFNTFEPKNQLGLNDIVKSIKHAKTDPKIKGIYIETPILMTGIATVDAIRNAILEFKESGKFIISYNEFYTENAYYLATAGTKIYVNPEGLVEFNGLNTEIMYLKGTMEKLGIDLQVFRGNDNIYKAAVEPYILDKMSTESREQTSLYVNTIWQFMLEGISVERGIPTGELNNIADNFKFKPDSELINNKLIDGIRYKDEIIAELEKLSETPKNKDIKLISLSEYSHSIEEKKNDSNNKIAIIYATGEIVTGKGEDGKMVADDLSATIRKARKDSTIKAIVLRINSGGGSALGAEIIWREVMLTQKVKPVIVSMANVAASGAYYMAAPADTIVAQPLTITGSIGVYGIVPNLQKMFNQKLGITFDGVKTNKVSDAISLYRPLTDAEKILINQSIGKTYDIFITRVAEGRNLSKEKVNEIARGRVWDAVHAKEKGLVDVLGGIDDAISIAAWKANLKDFKLEELPKQKNPLQELMGEIENKAKTSLLKQEFGDYYLQYKEIQRLLNADRIQAKMPFEINIY